MIEPVLPPWAGCVVFRIRIRRDDWWWTRWASWFRAIHSVVTLVVAVVACDLVQRKARAPGENLIVHWT